MKRTIWLCAPALLAILNAASADEKAAPPAMSAEDKAMMAAMEKSAALGPNHKLLEPMVGNWNVAGKMWMKPGAPPMESTATAVTKSIMGGRWIQQDYDSSFMGQPFTGMGLTGYDNIAAGFVSTWIDNQSTMIMVNRGRYDAASKTFTLIGDMDDPMRPGKKTRMREVVKIVDNDKHVLEMYESHEGKEAKMMELTYTRKK
jgi:Protein of unknown function (DUF1579)